MGAALEKVLPVFNGEGSDSAMLDNMLEFISMNGRSLMRAVSMLLPEPWDKNEVLTSKRSAWDQYQSMLTEAWEGPAAIAFSDGTMLGAVIDRNGLRPARYCVTSDDRLILSSEAGALDIDPAKILVSGSLGPGQMLMVDPEQGRVLYDDEIRDELANEKPYREWIKSETLALSSLIEGAGTSTLTVDDEDLPLTERQAVHGFCFEDIERPSFPWPTSVPCHSRPWRGYAARVPVGTSPPLLSLLQPAVLAGDEPAYRCIARIIYYFDATLPGQPWQPTRRCACQLPPRETRDTAAERGAVRRACDDWKEGFQGCQNRGRLQSR